MTEKLVIKVMGDTLRQTRGDGGDRRKGGVGKWTGCADGNGR